MSTSRPAALVRYEHLILFKAVHRPPHRGSSTQFPDPVHGHNYRLVLGFEGEALELPETDAVLATIAHASTFISTYMNGQDLSMMEFRTTPAGLAWYVSEHIADIGPVAGLVDIAVTVDEMHRHVYRPEWAR